MLQSLEEAVVDLLQSLCGFGVPPAAGVPTLGCVLVHMELPRLEVQDSLKQQGIGVMLPWGQLQHFVDVLLCLVKVFSVQIQLTCADAQAALAEGMAELRHSSLGSHGGTLHLLVKGEKRLMFSVIVASRSVLQRLMQIDTQHCCSQGFIDSMQR